MKNKKLYMMVDDQYFQQYFIPSGKDVMKYLKKEKLDIVVDKGYCYVLDFSSLDKEKEVEVLDYIIYLSKLDVLFTLDLNADTDGFRRSIDCILGLVKDLCSKKDYVRAIALQQTIISELSLLYEKHYMIREKRYGRL